MNPTRRHGPIRVTESGGTIALRWPTLHAPWQHVMVWTVWIASLVALGSGAAGFAAVACVFFAVAVPIAARHRSWLELRDGRVVSRLSNLGIDSIERVVLVSPSQDGNGYGVAAVVPEPDAGPPRTQLLVEGLSRSCAETMLELLQACLQGDRG